MIDVYIYLTYAFRFDMIASGFFSKHFLIFKSHYRVLILNVGKPVLQNHVLIHNILYLLGNAYTFIHLLF